MTMTLEHQIQDRMSRIPMRAIKGTLKDAVVWKDATSDAMKLLQKRNKSESELRSMLNKLNTLAGEA